MAEFILTRAIEASPATVFATITDHRAYPEFTPIRKAVLEREGDPPPNGVGAVRALHLIGPPIREQVIAFEEPSRFSYRVLSGVPVRSQVGTVTIEPRRGGEGSLMWYEVEVEPLVPLSRRPTLLLMRAALGRLMAGVGREAERRDGPGG